MKTPAKNTSATENKIMAVLKGMGETEMKSLGGVKKKTGKDRSLKIVAAVWQEERRKIIGRLKKLH